MRYKLAKHKFLIKDVQIGLNNNVNSVSRTAQPPSKTLLMKYEGKSP